MRFSEKLFERVGITIETLDLSEVIGRARKLAEDDARVTAKTDAIRAYVPTRSTPSDALARMARLGVVIDQWMEDNRLDASAIQCWTALEELYGIVPCTLMSMMSNAMLPGACEMDIPGLVGMVALALASGSPSAIVDWNNNYGGDPDKAVIFHCSNLPKALFNPETVRMDYQAIITGTVGRENTHGTVVGRARAEPFTFCRVSTDDLRGRITAYLGEDELTDDRLETFGGYGVVHVPRLQALLRHICERGFEHHVAINLSQTARAVN